MASYSVADLFVDLKVGGESDVRNAVAGVRSDLIDADQASSSFYQTNRKGYLELKRQLGEGQAAVAKLGDSFRSGELNAVEYAEALRNIGDIQNAARRAGGALAASVRDISGEWQEASVAASKFEAGTARAAAEVEHLAGELSRKGAAAKNAAGDLELLRREALRAAAGFTQLEAAAPTLNILERINSLGQTKFVDTGALKAKIAQHAQVVDLIGRQNDLLEEQERLNHNEKESEVQSYLAGVRPGRNAQVSAPVAGGVLNVPAASPDTLKRYNDQLTIMDSLNRAGVTNQGEFTKQLESFKRELMGVASGLDNASDEYREYIELAGRAGGVQQRLTQASLKDSYFSRQFILGNALSNIYGELGIRAIDFATNAVRAMDDVAAASERAQDGTNALLLTTAQSGESYEQVRAAVDSVSAKYFTLATDAEGAASALLASGASASEVAQLLNAVGATSVKNGTDVREAFAQIASSGGDVENVLISLTGASSGYQAALLDAAGGQSLLVGGLNDTQRRAALLAAVLNSSATAVRDYGGNVDGVIGVQLRQAEAVAKLRAELGEQLIPVVIRSGEMLIALANATRATLDPLFSAGELVARVAGQFSAAELAVIAFAALGVQGFSRLFVTMQGVQKMLPGLIAGMRALVLAASGAGAGLLGGGVLLAIGAAVAYFSDLSAEIDETAEAEKRLKTQGEQLYSGFEQLKGATTEDGLKGAVTELASTMDGEVRDSFVTFATDAIASAGSVSEAIAQIARQLAGIRAAEVELKLTAVGDDLALAQNEVVGFDQMVGPSGESQQVSSLKENLRVMREDLDYYRRQNDEEGVADMQAAIREDEALLRELQANSADGRRDAAQGEVDALQLEQRQLEQRLNMLRNRPMEALGLEFTLPGSVNNPFLPDDDGGNTQDPLRAVREQADVARAEMNRLKGEYERTGSEVAFAEMSRGTAVYLTSLDLVIAKMRELSAQGQLSSGDQVSLINAVGERANLVAEMAASPDADRERRAGSWVERLKTDLERDGGFVKSGMGELANAKRNLEAEMATFAGLEVLTPEQEARFGMLQRLMVTVEDALVVFRARLDEDAGAELFEAARKSVYDFVRAGETIPEAYLVNFELRGGDRAFFDQYNADLEATFAAQQAFVDLQREMANFSGNAAAADAQQGAGGEVVTPDANRLGLVRAMLAEALTLDPAVNEGLDAFITKLQGAVALMESSQGMEAGRTQNDLFLRDQRRFVVGARADAAEPAGFDEAATAAERAQLVVDSLTSSLDAAEGEFGEGSFAALDLAVDLAIARAELEGLAQVAADMEREGAVNAALKRFDAFSALGVRPPQADVDTLAGAGFTSEQLGVPLQEESAALRDARDLLDALEKGYVDASAYANEFLNIQSSLKSALDDSLDPAEAKLLLAALEEVTLKAAELSAEKFEIDFALEAGVASGSMDDDAFLAWGREKVAELKESQLALAPAMLLPADATQEQRKEVQAAQAAWLDYQRTITKIESEMDGTASTVSKVAAALTSFSANLRASGQDDSAGVFELFAAGASGFDAFIKNGGIEGGAKSAEAAVRAIGTAFSASADEGTRAMGQLLTGMFDLAKGVATGDPGSIISGTLSLVTLVIDVFTAGAKALAEGLKKIEEYESGFSVVDASGGKFYYNDTDPENQPSDRERQIMYDKYDEDGDDFLNSDEIDAIPEGGLLLEVPELVAAFQSLESSMQSLIKEKLKAYIETGNMEGFEEGVKEAVIDGLIEGFVASSVMQGIMGPALNDLAKVYADPNATQEQRDAAMDGVFDTVPAAMAAMTDFADGMREYFADQPWQPEVFDVGGAVANAANSTLGVDFVVGDTSALEAFQEEFGNSLRDYIKKQLVDAFLQSAAIKPLLDELGAYLGEALADGVISAGEQAVIDGYVNGIVDATAPLQEALAGLSGGSRVDVIVEKGELDDLLGELESIDSGEWERMERERLEAEKARLENEKRLLAAKIAMLKVEQQITFQKAAQAIAEGRYADAAPAADANAAATASIEEAEAAYASLDEQILALDESIAGLGDLALKDREKLVVKIKAELGIDAESVRSGLKSAFDAGSYEEFVSGFGASVMDTLRNALVTVFLETGPMKQASEFISDELFKALEDGELTAEEKERLLGLSAGFMDRGSEMYKQLTELGLIAKDFSKLSLGELYDDSSLDALDEIRSRLGATTEAFSGNLREAFDSADLGEFREKLKAGVKQSIRDALIAAFLESAAIKPLLEALSQGVLDAMADGELSEEEKAYLLGLEATLGQEAAGFFAILDELGFGFSDLAGTLGEVNESLTNVPEGFRVAAARYDVDDPNTRAGVVGGDDDEKEYAPVKPRDPKVTPKDPFEGVDPIDPIEEEMKTWEAPDWVALFNGVFGNIAIPPRADESGLTVGEPIPLDGDVPLEGVPMTPMEPVNIFDSLFGGSALSRAASKMPTPVLPTSLSPTSVPGQRQVPAQQFTGDLHFNTHNGFRIDDVAAQAERQGARKASRLFGSPVSRKG